MSFVESMLSLFVHLCLIISICIMKIGYISITLNDRPLIISIIMYANTTFLGSIDRLSATNPLTNTSRAICGVFGCIAYIIVVIVLYFGTVAAYLNGDYIQGSFVTLKHENNIMYSGCDFKLAISFS